MTTEQYIAKQRRLLKELKEKNKPLEIAARSAMALQANRIFIQGKLTSGSDIGQYDTTKSFYVNPDYAPRKSPNKAKGIKGLKRTGKTGRSKFSNGSPHKTSYQKSYKDFKKNIGQKSDKVRLHLSGDLESDFRNAPIDSVKVNPHKISANEYQIRLSRPSVNGEKLEGLQSKYGRITDMSSFERKEFIRIAGFELRKHFTQ